MGQEINLSGIGYGRVHWESATDVCLEPFNYYYFLAGLVRVLKAQSIVEVGTHQGGSARAMAAGFEDPARGKVVTFDITRDGVELLAGHPTIRPYNLDANSDQAYRACLEEFCEPSVDMAFIDAAHEYDGTMKNFLFCSRLSPAYFVFDDICLNEGMRGFWKEVCSRYGDNALDVSDLLPEVRTGGVGNPGFGILRATDGDDRI